MPMLGIAQETGKLIRWLKAEGDTVAKGEPLIEVETDKVTVEIEAPAAGTLSVSARPRARRFPSGCGSRSSSPTGRRSPSRSLRPARPPPRPARPAKGPPSPPGSTTRACPGTARRRRRRRVETGARLAEGAPARPGAGRADRRDRGLRSVRRRRRRRRRGVGRIERARPVRRRRCRHRRRARSSPSPRPGGRWPSAMQRSWQDVPHFFLQRDVDASRLNSWRDAARAGPATSG